MSNPVGRPSKYNSSMVAVAQEYIDSCSREQTELPTIEGLALKLDVDDETIGIWANAKVKDEKGEDTEELLYPDFSATVKRIFRKQKNQLMNDGLYGGKEVNTAMAIFLLKANHGLKETSVTELTGKGGVPLLSTLKDVSNNDSSQEAKTTKQEN